MKAHFNIYGLPLELSADHPLLFENFLEDLRYFQTKKPSSSKETVRLSLTAIPSTLNGDSYPAPFTPYQEIAVRHFLASNTSITCFGKSAVTVLTYLKTRTIQTGIILDPSLVPDPAYHLCFAQPVSPWLKALGFFSLHAGCVALESEGILMVGLRRSGKSTLSLSAVREGFKFLSDEQPLLSLEKGRLQAHALPRRIRLNRSVAQLFPELRSLTKSSPLERLIFPIEQFWPQCLTRSCEPRVLIFPKFLFQGRLKVFPLEPLEALNRLLQDDHFIWYRNKPWNRISQLHLNLFERLVHQTKAFAIDYGKKDILRIPEIFRQLLRD